MKVIISESRLIDVAVTWVGSTFGDAVPVEWSGKYQDFYYPYQTKKIYTQDDEIIFTWFVKDNKVIVHGSQIGDQLMKMFGLEYEQAQDVIRKWLNNYYSINPKTIYFGKSFTPFFQ